MARSAQPRYLDGKSLRRMRLAAGLGQAALASKVGVGQSHVSNWELSYNGCGAEMLRKLADALGCETSDLMREEVAALPETTAARSATCGPGSPERNGHLRA
jgi:transcriptional regulator with XRE-family HTH domain